MNNKHVLTGFAIALLIYSGWRTWDYMSQYLLKGVGVTTSMVIGAAFLFVTELGYLAWLHLARPHATTDVQETTAGAMIYIDLMGSLAIGLADLLVHNTLYSFNAPWLDPVLLFTPWLLIAANLIGYTIYHTGDSDEQLARAERRLHHEEVKLEMEARTQAINELKSNMQGLAGKLAPHYYKDLTDRVTGRTLARFERKAKEAENESTEPQASAISGNGKAREYRAETEKVNPTK